MWGNTYPVVKGDKILLSLGIEIIGVDCVFRELGLVSWILTQIYMNKGHLSVHHVADAGPVLSRHLREHAVREHGCHVRQECVHLLQQLDGDADAGPPHRGERRDAGGSGPGAADLWRREYYGDGEHLLCRQLDRFLDQVGWRHTAVHRYVVVLLWL
jgi:hypothetical protein